MNAKNLIPRILTALGLVTLGVLLASPFGGVVAMATTLVTDDAMQAAMKIIFDDVVVDNSITESEFMDVFQESGGIQEDQTTGGRYIETAQMFALPSGVGFRAEDGYIPIPDGPVIENSRVYLKQIFGSVRMSGQTMKRVRSSEGAFLNYAERALPGVRERATNDMDHYALGTGSGIRARVAEASVANPVVVDSAFGVAGWEGAHLQFTENERLRASPNLDGSNPRATTYKVTAIDHDVGGIVLDSVTNLVDDDYLFEGDEAGNSAGLAAMGVAGIIDNGDIVQTFQGIDRTAHPRWGSFVMDVPNTTGFDGNTELTEDVVHYADDEAFVRGKAKVDTIVTSRLGFRQCFQDLRTDRSINDPRGYTGGPGKGVEIMLGGRRLNLRVARKIPTKALYGITKSTMRRWFVNEWEWDTTTGSLWRQVTDATGVKHAFFAYGHMQYQLGCSDPQKNYRIEGWSD